ncbi:MAG: NTP/NDP exchange transporter [Rickettsiaceae bacterium]|nr:MAG: NTP/NDP exchange transporter [Rickettsiaceae bacterium]
MIVSPFLCALTKLKEVIWPIKKDEMKLFLPLSLMMMCMLFNFGALRSIKDSLIVPAVGAEAISFLKLWLVLPSSVIFTLIYMKLSNKLNYEHLFYTIISLFLVFFLFFAFIIYPNQNDYHPSNEMIELLVLKYQNFQWFIKILGRWSYALMYIFSELWSVVVINLMFWQFANQIFDTEKAKRFYPVLGMIGNLGLVIAGIALMTSSTTDVEFTTNLATSHNETSQMLKTMTMMIVSAGIISMILLKIIHKFHLIEFNQQIDHTTTVLLENTKTKLSLKESIQLILRSKYIGHIVILILCYGLLINILEGPWKAKIREMHSDTLRYANFMGHFNIWMGISSVTFMIIGSNILRNFSWLRSAMLTPIMIGVTGTIFFIFTIFNNDLSLLSGFNPIHAAVFVGALQNILSKATKYSLFDSTKEMAYIPLPLELKTKGKAAVEIIGLKFGKSLGAFIQSMIFVFLPQANFDSIVMYLMTIFIVVIVLWLWNLIELNREYLKFLKR